MKIPAALLFVFTLLGAPAAMAQDAAAGERKAHSCLGCHSIPRYQSSFPEVHKVPLISGQSPKYIVAALTAYRKGDRKHPTMRAIAASLTDQDIADLAAFYAPQAGKAEGTAAPPAPPVAALLQRGACVACPGADYLKSADPSPPKLAGQHADYLYVALRAYRTEGNGNIGRSNAIMAGMVKQYSSAELKQIAEYIGALPGDLRTVEQRHFK